MVPASPPWRAQYISSDDESSYDFPRLRRPRSDEIITPGVIIEELPPELTWVEPAAAIEDGLMADPSVQEAHDDVEDEEEGGEKEIEADADHEVDLSSEAAAKAAAAALQEAAKADKAWNSPGGLTLFSLMSLTQSLHHT